MKDIARSLYKIYPPGIQLVVNRV